MGKFTWRPNSQSGYNQSSFGIPPALTLPLRGAVAPRRGGKSMLMLMGRTAVAAVVMAVSAPSVAQQQGVLLVPMGNEPVTPVAQTATDPKDSPEDIAKDAARDLKDSRFYNKPSATRADYNTDWQQCRLIARGSRTPSGMIPYAYNPAVMSPIAAGIGAGIGGAIAAAIVEGQQRRENRRNCLMMRGWRLVELPAAEQARVAALGDVDRDAYFNTIVGAREVAGKITERKDFFFPRDPVFRADTPLTSAGTVWIGKKVDPRQPVSLTSQEAAVVVGFRRVEQTAVGKSGAITLLRYDPAHKDVLFRPKDWKKIGDTTTYSIDITSREKQAVYEVQLLRVTPGDYVINSTAAGNTPAASTNCFGAPAFHISAGEIVYLGDFIPYVGVKLSDGKKFSGLGHSMHPDDARRTLAAYQPQAAAAMRPAQWRNNATYSCAGVVMTRWDMEGVPSIEE